MKAFPHQNSTFTYTCRACGFKLTSDKNPQGISLFGSSDSKIEGRKKHASISGGTNCFFCGHALQ